MEPQVSTMSYRAVVQEVLLFGDGDLSYVGGDVPESGGGKRGIPKSDTGQMAVQQKDGTWRCVVSEKFLKK